MPAKPARRPRRRVRRAPRRKAAKRLAASEFASMKQTISLVQDPMNQVFRLDDINLSKFDRASALGACYQYYRITKVELQFKPLQDTFNQSTAQSVPYLFYLLMKGDNLDCGTFNQLRDAGAKAIRLDDKTIKVSWRPYVSQGVIGEDTTDATNPSVIAWSLTKTSPWLGTQFLPASESITYNPSQVPHKGILYGVQMENSLATQYYDVDITCHFQFKKPMVNAAPGGTPVHSTHKEVIDKEDVPPSV